MNSALFHSLLVFIFSSDFVAAQAPTLPRWGQAASLVQDTLFVHAGRVDQYNSYSYSSAPVSNDLFSLSLSSSFDVSSPPWQYIGGCSTCPAPGPAVAWHTLSAFNTSHILLFGGDPGPNSPIVLPEKPDSVTLLDINNRQAPSWDSVAESWANQPLRRMYHSASSSGGNIWIVGGLKTDGSNMAFSEHYLFDPHGPSFTQLPSTNGPPDIFGHTSLVLSTGRLLVFGGYSPSQDTMFRFDTIWVVDTTLSSPTWTTLSVSNSSLPSPRRGFAATVLPGDKVLIQGGGDSVLQTIYSDGWILDTSQNPMLWSSVEALSQVGPRIDHLAVSVGSTVIFGFGYSGSGAAPSSLSVFDTTTSTFLSSYVPPPPTSSSLTTLPAATPSSGPHSGNSPQHSASATPAHPSPSSGSSNGTNGEDQPSSNIVNTHTTVIALGTVFGVMALLVATTGIAWYMRQHKRSQESFHLLGPSSDDGSPHMGPIIPVAGVAGTREKGEATVARTTRDRLYGLVQGRFGTTTQEQRRDMLADEDTRQFDAEFGWIDTPQGGSGAGLRRGTSSGQSSWRSVMRPATLTDRVHDSLVSLRNVGGAVLGYATGSAGGKSARRDASAGSRSTGWRGEKEASDPFTDNYGLNKPLPSPRPRMGRQGSSFSYKDPFEDYEVEPFNYDYDPRGGYIRESVDEDGYPSLLDPPPRPYLPAKLPPLIAVDLTHLPPVSEQRSLSTVIESNNTPTNSSQSLPHTSTTLENSSSSSSNSHDPIPRSPPRKPSSIIDANHPSAIPIRRSNSWWTRFAKAPLLDRRLSGSTTTGRSSHGPIEIRDPNPLPPRLVPIKESSGPSPESSHIRSTSATGEEIGNHRQFGSGGSGKGGSGRRHGHGQVYSTHQHGRSASSFQTSRTADSEMIERMGRTMDIIQRGSYYSDRSFSTERERSESGGTPEPPPPVPPIPLSIITSANAMGTQAVAVEEKDSPRVGSSALDDAGMLVQSPEDLFDDLSTTIKGRPFGGPSSPPPIFSPTAVPRSPPPRQKSKSPTGNGKVATRVQMFEKRLSEQRQQEEEERARSPPPKRSSVLPTSPSAAAAVRTTSPGGKTRLRPSVYGVVPKPSLFVANPDSRERSASD